MFMSWLNTTTNKALLTILIVLLLYIINNVGADVDLISEQGKVTYRGVLLSSGNLTISIYDDPVAGNKIYEENFTDGISGGYYDVLLGNTTDMSLIENNLYYMDISVNGNDFDFSDGERKVFQAPTGNSSNITGNLWVDTDTLFVDSTNNRVGIGLSDPSFPLHILNTAGHNVIVVDSDGYCAVQFLRAYGLADNIPSIAGRKARGSYASPSGSINGDTLLRMGGAGYGNTSFATSNKAMIEFTANQDWNDTYQGTQIKFLTTQAGTTTTSEKMRITGSGDVGIGTSSPAQKLDVAGTIQTTGNIIMDKAAAKIDFGSGADSGPHIIDFADDSGTNQLKIVYRSSPNQLIVEHSDTEADIFWIDDDTDYAYFAGSVGIGDITPDALLDVAGEFRADGIAGDGNGKVVCIKSDGDLGTCSDQPGASGTCTCGWNGRAKKLHSFIINLFYNTFN